MSGCERRIVGHMAPFGIVHEPFDTPPETQGDRQARYWRKQGYSEGFVYVLEAPPLTAVKVGYTTAHNPTTRLKGIQTGCPYPLKVRCVIPAPRKLETWIHHYMQPARTSGEWFDGKGIPTHLERIENMADSMRQDHPRGQAPVPDWEKYAEWIPRRIRKPPGKHQPVTVRHVDPATLRAA